MASEESHVYRASWRKQLVLVALHVAIATVCYFQSKKFPPMLVIGGFVAVLGAVVLWGAIRGWTVLTLDSHGFEYLRFDESKRYIWRETSDFVSGGYEVLFRKNDTEEQAILNLFAVTTNELCETLASYREKYGKPED